MQQMMKLVTKCLRADEPEHHTPARIEMAKLLESQGKMKKATSTLDDVPPEYRSVAYLYTYGLLHMKENGAAEDGYDAAKGHELMCGAALLLRNTSAPAESEALQGETAAERWASWRAAMARKPLDDVAEHVVVDGHGPVVLQELVDHARRTQEPRAYVEALFLAHRYTPYNQRLRRFIVDHPGAAGDLANVWSAFALPRDVEYTEAIATDVLGAFLASLPKYATGISRLLLTPKWGEGLLAYLNDVCDAKVEVAKGDGVSRETMHGLILRCMHTQGILKQWEAIAKEGGTTVEAIFKKTKEQLMVEDTVTYPFTASVSHYAAALGKAFSEELPVSLLGSMDGNDQTPADILNQLGAIAEPGLEAPCWVELTCTYDTDAFPERLAATKAAYDKESEWGRLRPTDDEEAEADFKKWVPWEEREDFPAEVFAARLSSEEPTMEVDYVTLKDPRTFVNDFVAKGRPVVLADALPADKKTRDEQKTMSSYKFLARVLGKHSLPFSDRPHIDDPFFAVGGGSKASVFAFSYEIIRLYKQQVLFTELTGPWKAGLVLPTAAEGVIDTNQTSMVFTAGGSGSGYSFHSQTGHSLHYMSEGRRVWLLLPPTDAFVSPLPALQAFISAVDDKLPVLEFQQLPGDAVYVPPGWAALYVNLRGSAGWSANFASGSATPFYRMPQGAPSQKAPQTQSSMSLFCCCCLIFLSSFSVAHTIILLVAEDGMTGSVKIEGSKKGGKKGAGQGSDSHNDEL